MKKINKIIFAIVLFVVSFTCAMVSANEYGFYETITVNSKEEAEKKLEEQLANAEKFNENLGECTYLEYSGEIAPNKVFLDKITAETVKEKESIMEEYKEEDGYTTTVTVTYDKGVKTNYKFNVLNNKVTSAFVSGIETNEYNGKSIDDVLKLFVDTENDEYKIVVSLNETINTEDNGPVTTITEREAQKLVSELKNKGYTNVSYVSNNTKTSNKTIVSRTEMTESKIKEQLESENTNKEVVIKNITTDSKPNTKTYENLSDSEATNKKQELENTNLYELVVKNEKINKNDTTKIKTAERYNENDKPTIPYTEPVFEKDALTGNDIEVGYKYYYYGERELVSEADSIKKEFLTEKECKELSNKYKALGYTVSCEKVTTTMIEESEDDKFHFNEDKQTTRTWSHLDLSLSQTVNFYNEKSEVIGSAKGTLSNVSAHFYRNNEKISLVYSSSASSDAGRLEYCQTNSTDRHCGNWYSSDTNFTITSEDYVTVLATITYKNLAGETIKKDIILEGYLDNIFNVCRQNDDIGGGFDLKLAIAVDKDGNHIVNFTTEEVWTFNGSIDAEYNTPIVYDEYRYGKLYDVIAEDLDYTYTVTYLVTDYTVSYNGMNSIYELNSEYFDKNQILDIVRTTYTVTTIGEIKEDKMCGVGDVGAPSEDLEEEEEIVPPHTDVEISTTISVNPINNLYYIVDDKKRK